MYDITIIGAGVSGVFLAHTLAEEHPDVNIHVIDKGKPLVERTCGLQQESCICDGPCDRYIGFAGLGKSEGKFNYTNDFGGQLGKKIGEEATLSLMEEVDELLCSYGGDLVEKYSTKNEKLSKKAAQHSLRVFSTEVRHLGTQLARGVFQSMYEVMSERLTFTFEADVTAVTKENGRFSIDTNHGRFQSRKVVFATGMSGGEWLKSKTRDLGLKAGETRLDLGVRVEMRGNQLDAILQETFETKLHYINDRFSATTYCMNPRGRIIRKYQHGLVMADGQNQNEEEPSQNLNFTLFVPRYFKNQAEAMAEAHRVIGGINQGQDRIVAQKLGDLLAGKTSIRLDSEVIHPSLEAEAGDLQNEVPPLYLEALLEFFEALEGLLGEKIDCDTILYGMDSKFYEAKIFTDKHFETELQGLYLIGDCSGETHSLSQAAASGIYLARCMKA
ncbi:NAD(FAD)-utilizing dehydrogenase [Halobacillus sp. GSS1]|uniref:NAD(FAD)-utilizing dehydrogenase n=1 Tax=Halobacillus sp. GSS1 TaxID=2815919 RepID=UPI001A8DE221|nr:NAD(FAD)-utilizing dehydrogenase [Halobacillus sp. GSS1]MBN9653210.1 NAD(FAD)-utilizing dehydrogenase [Halobacillus sp. GSS1]